MEKGRILEAWAEKDPAKFDDAVGPLGQAPRPAAARCGRSRTSTTK